MIHNKKITKIALLLAIAGAMSGCTKLDEKLNSTLTNAQVSSSLGAAGTGLLLSAAYTDLTILGRPGPGFLTGRKYLRRITWFLPGVVTGMIMAYGEYCTIIHGMPIMDRF